MLGELVDSAPSLPAVLRFYLAVAIVSSGVR